MGCLVGRSRVRPPMENTKRSVGCVGCPALGAKWRTMTPLKQGICRWTSQLASLLCLTLLASRRVPRCLPKRRTSESLIPGCTRDLRHSYVGLEGSVVYLLRSYYILGGKNRPLYSQHPTTNIARMVSCCHTGTYRRYADLAHPKASRDMFHKTAVFMGPKNRMPQRPGPSVCFGHLMTPPKCPESAGLAFSPEPSPAGGFDPAVSALRPLADAKAVPSQSRCRSRRSRDITHALEDQVAAGRKGVGSKGKGQVV